VDRINVEASDVEASATFPKGISLNTPILKFGDVPPGKVAKRARVIMPKRVITPKSAGCSCWLSPMVMCEYAAYNVSGS